MYGVYCLKDSDGIVRYIGKGKVNEIGTCNRWVEHKSLANSLRLKRKFKKEAYRVHHWLAKHKGWEFSWVVTRLEEKQAYQRERELVEEHRALIGRKLLNTSEGGIGLTSEEAKEIANRPEVKEKKRQAVLKRWRDPKYRAKLKKKLGAANRSERRREQSRQNLLKEWESTERREAARKRAKELWADPVWAAKRRAELVARNKKGKTA